MRLPAKSRQSARLDSNSFRQPTWPYRRVHGPVTPDGRRQLGSREKPDARNLGRHAANPGTTSVGRVHRRHPERRSSRIQEASDLLRSRDELTTSARQSQEIEAAASQQSLDPLAHVTRSDYAGTKILGEQIPDAGCIYHISVSTQPQTPSGKTSLGVGDYVAGRIDNEANEGLAARESPGGGATP